MFKFSSVLSTFIPIHLNLETKPKPKELMEKQLFVGT